MAVLLNVNEWTYFKVFLRIECSLSVSLKDAEKKNTEYGKVIKPPANLMMKSLSINQH